LSNGQAIHERVAGKVVGEETADDEYSVPHRKALTGIVVNPFPATILTASLNVSQLIAARRNAPGENALLKVEVATLAHGEEQKPEPTRLVEVNKLVVTPETSKIAMLTPQVPRQLGSVTVTVSEPLEGSAPAKMFKSPWSNGMLSEPTSK